MYRIFVLFLLLITTTGRAQHCPWDCGGLLLLKTGISPGNFYKLSPVLVDENKNLIVDSIYGTGKESYDTCKFLSYEDFLRYRTQRTSIIHGMCMIPFIILRPGIIL